VIAIVDYGLGNVKAFANVYAQSNIAFVLAKRADELLAADRIILPGVGAFDQAMLRLEQSGLRETLDELVVKRRVPVLGVCVGMQMLAASSEEGRRPGLGWIDGDVRRFRPAGPGDSMRVPHMGWNGIRPVRESALLAGLERDALFYFLHSYYYQSHRPEDVIAVSDYHGEFASAVSSGNVHGVQFHPEKSHQWGIRLLRNFAGI
jgi:imidazole glycerol-phosphate synthase subunit HisH